MLSIVIISAIIANAVAYKGNDNTVISFREALDLVDIPIVTFKFKRKNGKDIKLNLVIDTGATNCFIDKTILNLLDIKETKSYEGVVCGMGGSSSLSSKHTLEFSYDSNTFVTDFVEVDLSEAIKHIRRERGLSIAGQIGSIFLNSTNADIDYMTYKISINNDRDNKTEKQEGRFWSRVFRTRRTK